MPRPATANPPKMVTLSQLAAGSYSWNQHDEARIERNLFAFEGESFEALRFCKRKDGRHTRVHLVISRQDFLELFRDAAENGVFEQEDLEKLQKICAAAIGKAHAKQNPLLDVIGIGSDGRLAQDIDESLYGGEPA